MKLGLKPQAKRFSQITLRSWAYMVNEVGNKKATRINDNEVQLDLSGLPKGIYNLFIIRNRVVHL